MPHVLIVLSLLWLSRRSRRDHGDCPDTWKVKIQQLVCCLKRGLKLRVLTAGARISNVCVFGERTVTSQEAQQEPRGFSC